MYTILSELETEEAIHSALDKVYYYSYLPKHIKGTAVDLENPYSVHIDSTRSAYVVNGSVTIIGGRVNIPDIN